MEAAIVTQVFDGEAEQFGILLRCGMPCPPPEPVAVVLMPGTHDDRDQGPVCAFSRRDRVGQPVQVRCQIGVPCTSWKH